MPIVYIGKLMGMKKRSARERSEFGQRMAMARNRIGLRQEEVCAKLEISQGTLSGLEGKDQSSSLVFEFADLYRCSPRWLATGKGDPEYDGVMVEHISLPADILGMARRLAEIKDANARELILIGALASIEKQLLQQEKAQSSIDTKQQPGSGS